MPLRDLKRLQPIESSNPDLTDIVLFEVAHELLSDEERCMLRAVDLDLLIRNDLTLIPEKSLLALAGYPFELSRIDYEECVISRQRLIIDGVFTGASSHSGCFGMRFLDVSKVRDHNGLSGSPVFSLQERGPTCDCHLAGMHLRGSNPPGKGYFLSSAMIFRSMQILFGT